MVGDDCALKIIIKNMKYTIYRKIANQDGELGTESQWRNYLVQLGERKYHIGYNSREKRFSNFGNEERFDAYQDSDEIRSAVVSDANKKTFTPGVF